MVFIRLVRSVLRLILLLTARLEVAGLQNLPTEEGFILTPNHLSMIDAPVLFLALPMPPLRLYYFAGEKWAEHPVYGPIMKRVFAIFINRGQVDRRALREAQEILRRGDALGIAPEGTRSRTGGLQRAKGGAAYLASRTDIPLVPCAIIHSDEWGENVVRLRRTTVRIIFGEPYRLPHLDRRSRSADLAAYSHLIMVKIAQLLPPRYRGYYADSPALAALERGEDPFPYCLQAEGALPPN